MLFAKVNQRRKRSVNSSINVTPLVDVMLVLLIIFMVTSPMLVSEIKVDLPKSDKQTSNESSKKIVITITKDGKLYLNKKLVSLNSLKEAIHNLSRNNKQTTVFLRGDKKAKYQHIIEVMNHLNKLGYNKVSLVTEID